MRRPLLLAGLFGTLLPACSTTTPDDAWVAAHWPPQAWHESPTAVAPKAPAPPGWDALLALPWSSDPGALEALLRVLDGEDPELRARAAFALGVRGDAEALEPLRLAGDDPDPAVRAAAVDAATRLEGAVADDDWLRAALADASPEVRGAAAIACHRLPKERLVQSEEDQRSGLPTSVGGDLLALAASDPDGEVRWRALWTLGRVGVGRPGAALFAARCSDPSVPDLERVFAARALARVVVELDDPGARDALHAALQDEDWRVAAEALRGLSALADPSSVEHLVEATRHPSFHVRALAVRALGDFPEAKERTAVWAVAARMDPSRTVRVAQLVTVARLYGDGVDGRVTEAARSADPVLRAGAAEAARHLPAFQSRPLLLGLSADPHPRVAGTAIEGLAGLLPDEDPDGVVAGRLRELLAGPDNGLRLAALLALEEHLVPADLPALRRAFDASTGDVGSEVRFHVLQATKGLHPNGMPNPGVVELLLHGLEDGDPHVSRVAAAELRALRLDHGTRERPGPERLAFEPAQLGRTPTVELDTPHGTLVLRLYPDEAPTHVANFVERVRSGFYDGLDFHRVVTDFVVQGGCYRGDGNGAGTWRGATDALPAEFGPTPYLRGALGMPRNEDPHSGGSQIFLTHVPTPHLDGRYTLFGQLVEGFEALDALEVGDRILRARLVFPAAD